MLGMLVALALAGSIFPLRIDPGGELFLSGIALLVIVRKYGALPGALAALLCGLSTYALLGHPFAALISLAEVLVLALLLARCRVRLFFADAFYWSFLGLPLSWYFRFSLLHAAPSSELEYLLLQGACALGCSVVACLLIVLPPLRSRGKERAVSIWEGAFNLVLCIALAPLAWTILLNVHQMSDVLEPDLETELVAGCIAIEEEQQELIEALTKEQGKLAETAVESRMRPSTLIDRRARSLRKARPEFLHIEISDAEGNLLSSAGRTGLRERPLENLRRDLRPVMSGVLKTVAHSRPHVRLHTPIVKDGRFFGAVAGLIDLESMKKSLKKHAKQGTTLTLIDRRGEVAASTDPGLKKRGNLFEAYPDALIFLWDPQGKRLLSYPPWKRRLFSGIPLDSPDTLLLALEIPEATRLAHLRRAYANGATAMLMPALVVALACWTLGRRLIPPLRQLANATMDLPRKVEAGEKIAWPKMMYPEVEALARNSMAMASAMRNKIDELALARQESTDALDDVLSQRKWESFTTGRKLRLEMDESKRIAGLLADLESAESQYRFLMEKAMVGVFIIQDGKLTYANPKFAEIFGYAQKEILKQGDLLWYIHPEERPLVVERHRRYMTGKAKTSQYELRGTTKQGRNIHLEVIDGRGDYNGEPAIIGTLMDITHRKEAEETIKHMAYHDPLTDLPNRPLFKDHAEQALAFADRNQHMAAILFMDLDRFKQINDTLGHGVGDGLLKEVAARLKGCVRDIDKVSRYGGDEFNLLLAQITHEDHAALVAHKIVRTLQWPFDIEGHEIYATCSIGIAIYPKNGLDVDTLIKNADTALYRAKDLGRNNYQVFTENMNSGSMEKMELENRLRKALERNELKVHYQPQVNLLTGRIVGMEALVRWELPSGEQISPAVFIPMAEELGLILPIGEWILQIACRQAMAWAQEGMAPLRLGVNVSAFQFQDKGFMEMLEGAIQESGIDPRNLNLEITETIVMDDVKANVAKLSRIQDVGITVAIDDFGIGYSSLSYLKDFPVDQLKMDRAFVQSLPESADDAKIARHIVELAHSLGIAVVAEGVERPGQLEFLRSIGCDEVQGYLVSRPVPAQEFHRLQKQEEPFRLALSPPSP